MDKTQQVIDKQRVTDIKQPDKISEPIKIKVEKSRSWPKFAGFLVIVLAGILSGYFLVNPSSKKNQTGDGGKFNSSKTIGSTNTRIFRDQAEGNLEKGGINGEGTHKLIRPGGESQNVYLTSSVVNLDDYVGKEVRVWGETLAAQKAGWFMDVGRLEVK